MSYIEENEKNLRDYLSDRGRLIGTVIGAGIGLYAGEMFLDSITIQDFPTVINYSLRGLFLLFNTALARKGGEYLGDIGGYALYKCIKLQDMIANCSDNEKLEKNILNEKDLLEHKIKQNHNNILI